MGALASNETWKQLFVDEMRKRGASGRQLGDAWATVEEYCVESQQTAVDAFGDPVAYARNLVPAPRRVHVLVQELPDLVWFVTFGMAAWMPTVWSGPVRVNWDNLALVLLMLVVLTAQRLLWPELKRRTGRGYLGWFAGCILTWIAYSRVIGWKAHAFTCPGWALWTLFAVLSVVTIGLARHAVADRMVDPVTGRGPDGIPAWAFTLLWLLSPLVPAILVGLRVLA